MRFGDFPERHGILKWNEVPLDRGGSLRDSSTRDEVGIKATGLEEDCGSGKMFRGGPITVSAREWGMLEACRTGLEGAGGGGMVGMKSSRELGLRGSGREAQGPRRGTCECGGVRGRRMGKGMAVGREWWWPQSSSDGVRGRVGKA